MLRSVLNLLTTCPTGVFSKNESGVLTISSAFSHSTPHLTQPALLHHSFQLPPFRS